MLAVRTQPRWKFMWASVLVLAVQGAAAQQSRALAKITAPLSAICGDGIVELGEQCDNGNQNAIGGSCLPTCQIARCGDSYVQGSESCDLGPRNGAPGSHCSASCTID